MAFEAVVIGSGFVLLVAICILGLNLHEGLVAGIIVGGVGWLIAGTLLCHYLERLRPKKTLSVAGHIIHYGNQSLDLSRPFFMQVHADGMKQHLQIDLAQEIQGTTKTHFAIELEPIARDQVTQHFPSAGIHPIVTAGHQHTLTSEEAMEEHWPCICALLQALHAHAANAGPTHASEHESTPVVIALATGLLAMCLSTLVLTAIACLSWMPKIACLLLSPALTAAVWISLLQYTGRFGWLSLLAAQAMHIGGVYYASDWLMWSYGPPITQHNLSERGAFRANRPRRIESLQTKVSWGTPWMQERDGNVQWFYGMAAVVGPNSTKEQRVRLWAVCEKTLRGTSASQVFRSALTKNCDGAWQGKAMQPVPWAHWETYSKFVKRGAPKVGLRTSKHARIVYIFDAADVDWKRSRRLGLRLIFGPLAFWIVGALALTLWERLKRPAKAAH